MPQGAKVTVVEPSVGAARPLTTPSRRRGWGRRALLSSVIAALVVAGTIVGIRTMMFYAHHVETDDAQIDGHIAPVLARVAGYVTDVQVRDNQRVNAGEGLLQIDARDFTSRVSMAQAALANANAAVAVGEANVAAAKSKNTKLSQDMTRATTLRAQHVVSEQEYDAAKWAFEAAAAEFTAAERAVTAARAQVAQRQADLEYAQLQLSYTIITAPVSGTVSKKSIEVGQYIQAGQPLMAVVDDREIWVIANFKETQLRRMRVGQAATIEVDAYPHVQFHGRIESIAAATGATFSLLPPDNATGNFVKVVQRLPVKIVFTEPPDASHPMRVGMDVTAVVDLG